MFFSILLFLQLIPSSLSSECKLQIDEKTNSFYLQLDSKRLDLESSGMDAHILSCRAIDNTDAWVLVFHRGTAGTSEMAQSVDLIVFQKAARLKEVFKERLARKTSDFDRKHEITYEDLKDKYTIELHSQNRLVFKKDGKETLIPLSPSSD